MRKLRLSGYVLGPQSQTTVQIAEWSPVCVTLLPLTQDVFIYPWELGSLGLCLHGGCHRWAGSWRVTCMWLGRGIDGRDVTSNRLNNRSYVYHLPRDSFPLVSGVACFLFLSLLPWLDGAHSPTNFLDRWWGVLCVCVWPCVPQNICILSMWFLVWLCRLLGYCLISIG